MPFQIVKISKNFHKEVRNMRVKASRTNLIRAGPSGGITDKITSGKECMAYA